MLAGLAAALVLLDLSAASEKDSKSPLIKVAEYRLQQARQGAACAILDQGIYVFGGAAVIDGLLPARELAVRDGELQVRRSFQSVPAARAGITEVEILDTVTATVKSAPGTLLIRRYHAVIEHRGKFFIFGGQCDGADAAAFERRVEIYDPATGEVSFGPDMPEPRYGMAAVKLGAKAYLIGGTKFKSGSIKAQTNRTDVFDLELRTWTQGPPMPTPREARAEVVGEFILVVGGYRSRKAVDAVEMFVPGEDKWKTLPPLGRPVGAHALVLLGDRLFLFGDYSDLGSVVAYNLRTRNTEDVRAGFEGVRYGCAAVVGERIYVFGGNSGVGLGTETDLIQVFARNPAFASP
ncbi:MAG: hypothetical protein IAE82_02765 [Opitutaceae bacterium]|nr:hypothetical protein [Opitutaceae bacterium]